MPFYSLQHQIANYNRTQVLQMIYKLAPVKIYLGRAGKQLHWCMHIKAVH